MFHRSTWYMYKYSEQCLQGVKASVFLEYFYKISRFKKNIEILSLKN